jgi:hypothetical protein
MMNDEVSRAERALDVSLRRLISSRTEEEALNTLKEAIGTWVYSLREQHRKLLGDDMKFYLQMSQSAGGQTVEALVFARSFEIHELATWTAMREKGYSDIYADMYGVLTWSNPAPQPDKVGRDKFFNDRLAGRPVPETLRVAHRFLVGDIKALK